MADSAYRKCVICSISSHDFSMFYSFDLPFTEGIISACDTDFISAEETGKRFALELRTALKYIKSKKILVFNACSLKESGGKSQEPGAKMKVFLSEKFLNNHELRVGEIVWVRRVSPFPLEEVVVGISSEETYQWAHKFLATFLLKSLSSGPFTVRENDAFDLPNYQGKRSTHDKDKNSSEALILHCRPVLQGCITSETSLVISKLTMQGIQSSSEINETNTSALPSASLENYFVSDFARDLCPGGKLHDIPSDCIIDRTHKLQVNVLEGNTKTDKDESCDASSRVFVSLATLVDLHFFNGSWVKVHAKNPQVNRTEKDHVGASSSSEGSSNTINEFHIVQLVAAGSKNKLDDNFIGEDLSNIYPLANRDELKDKVAYISPLLYFNLFKKSINAALSPVIYITPINDTVIAGNEPSTNTASKTWKPPFATEAHIALVHSPHYKAGDSFDEALTSYFKVMKMLTVGDIFCVLYDWQETSVIGKVSSSGNGERWRNVITYFKVTKLVCEAGQTRSCFVDMEHSTLYQRGSVHSFVPAALEPLVSQSIHCCDIRPNYWEQTSPAGLSAYVDILESSVKPYLNSRENPPLSSCGILLTGPSGAGKRTVALATSRRLDMHTHKVSCYDLIGESVAATEARLKNVFQKAIFSSPCTLLLQNIDALGKDKEGNEDEPRIAATMMECISSLKEASDWPVVVMATSSSPNDITSDMFSCFLHEVKLEAPSEVERFDLLRGLAEMASVGNDVSFDQLAKRTAGLVLADFVALFTYAISAATRRLLGGGTEEASAKGETRLGSSFPWQLKLELELSAAGVKLYMQDFEDSLEILQSSLSDAIGAPKIPSVRWEDVGGLAEVKADILDTVQLPLQHPELFAAGLRRSGVLLYGPPGTGKTLLAKAVATECSLNFLSVKGPELINMYVGQSEQNVREVFTRAQSARPCVIFFDELDSLAPNRGRSGDSGGVMDRVVSQLLAELDGLHKACDVFVIGATNRPDLLDPALLRPGRFDKLLYLGVSEDRESQLNILRALTRKFTLHPDLQLEKVAALCPANLTGADFYALCSDAMLKSVKRKIELIEQGKTDSRSDANDIQVTEEDFQRALEALVPSVSHQELKRYKDLQHQFTAANNLNSKK